MSKTKHVLPILLIAAWALLPARSFAEERYDFLWVIGNSSMPAEIDAHNALVADFADFAAALQATKRVSYRMAMVTTDYFTNGGALVQAPSGLTLVDSTSKDPAGDFASLLGTVTDSATSFWPQGLEASRQAISHPTAGFPEAGVPLVVIYVTQDEDYSCQSHCYGIEPWDNPDWVPYSEETYSDYFRGLTAQQGISVSIFPIVGVSPNTCQTSGHGLRYLRVMAQVGRGQSGGVCKDQIHDSLLAIAQAVTAN